MKKGPSGPLFFAYQPFSDFALAHCGTDQSQARQEQGISFWLGNSAYGQALGEQVAHFLLVTYAIQKLDLDVRCIKHQRCSGGEVDAPCHVACQRQGGRKRKTGALSAAGCTAQVGRYPSSYGAEARCCNTGAADEFAGKDFGAQSLDFKRLQEACAAPVASGVIGVEDGELQGIGINRLLRVGHALESQRAGGFCAELQQAENDGDYFGVNVLHREILTICNCLYFYKLRHLAH